jgi:excisionase family DNA binding protein
MDLLLLGALACQAPIAMLSVPQADGRWNSLTYGTDTRDGVNDGQLFEVFARAEEAMEIADLVTALPRSPMVQPPHSMRWAYGAALRDESGQVVGVVAVLDRWLRQLTKREQRAVASMARQLTAQLTELRRNSASGAMTDQAAAEARGLPSDPGRPVFGPLPIVPEAPAWEHAVGRVPGRDLRSRRGPAGPAASGPAGGERHPLLRSQEVAELFDVTERTVINWAAAGKLPCLRTIGGHLRFRRDDVMRLLSNSGG